MARQIPLGQDRFAIVDDADFEWLNQSKWGLSGRDNRADGLYAARTVKVGGKARLERMHRLILGALPHQFVDHINNDSLDNRRCNLRTCTPAQNSANRRRNDNNKTGLKGVCFVRNRYMANMDGYLGAFKDRYEAALAYDRTLIARYGEFAKPNFDPKRDWIICGRAVGKSDPGPLVRMVDQQDGGGDVQSGG